jgi:hypothetical protein
MIMTGESGVRRESETETNRHHTAEQQHFEVFEAKRKLAVFSDAKKSDTHWTLRWPPTQGASKQLQHLNLGKVFQQHAFHPRQVRWDCTLCISNMATISNIIFFSTITIPRFTTGNL